MCSSVTVGSTSYISRNCRYMSLSWASVTRWNASSISSTSGRFSSRPVAAQHAVLVGRHVGHVRVRVADHAEVQRPEGPSGRGAAAVVGQLPPQPRIAEPAGADRKRLAEPHQRAGILGHAARPLVVQIFRRVGRLVVVRGVDVRVQNAQRHGQVLDRRHHDHAGGVAQRKDQHQIRLVALGTARRRLRPSPACPPAAEQSRRRCVSSFCRKRPSMAMHFSLRPGNWSQ